MGLLDLVLGKTNPFSQFVDQNKNTIHGAFAGFGQGPTVSAGLANAAVAANAGAPMDDAYAVQQAAEKARLDGIAQTAAWLKQNYPQYAGLPPEQGFEIASKVAAQKAGAPIDPASTAAGRQTLVKQFGLNGNDAATYVLTGKLPGSNQTARAGVGQPIPYRNKKTGQFVNVQPMTSGPGVNTVTGEPLDNLTDWEPAPYDLAAQRAGGTSDAQTAAAARTSLPGVEQAYAITKKAIGQLTGDPSVMSGQAENFSNFGGIVPQQMLPIIPKTNRANFQNVIDQLSGQAFLNIRQALKGAGQVTDFEGAKGEDAISRMKSAAARGDSDAFNTAVKDFNDALDNGIRLLREQAKGSYAAGAVPGLAGGQAQGDADPDIENILKGVGL